MNDGNSDLKKHKAGIQLAHIVLLWHETSVY